MPKQEAEQIIDCPSIPQNGRWIWKEESNTLEYVSNNPGADKQEKKKRAKGGTHFLQEFGLKMTERVTPNLAGRTGIGLRGARAGLHRSANRGKPKPGEEETVVSLQKVKDVAYDMLVDLQSVSPVFDDLYDTVQFDEFLVYMLSYYQCYFEKIAQDNKPNPMNIEPSAAELKVYEEICNKLEVAQKQLGKAYCILILGLGLEPYHHMACGLSRVSATYTDRDLYETLYEFISYVVWITFRRKEFDSIRKEVGRMLRSDTFNPALRVKNAPESADERKHLEKKTAAQQNNKNTPAEYRRLHPKRPAIKSIIHQRSPALVSILPSPKEEASWLFQKRSDITVQDDGDHIDDIRVPINRHEFKAGIIGEPISQFNQQLAPLGADMEDGEDEEGQGTDRRGSSMDSQLKADLRAGTAVTHTTTEACLSDEEDD
ncbi:protein phosphatase 1 regulatory subunit 36-like [Tubulanus polymorphus]|uniref:protein phosphatase 1 regulatory subunit 36-like n=1 Tax=Tubulanus polymorphus TaxID=672921 RepID=UPI003DA46928